MGAGPSAKADIGPLAVIGGIPRQRKSSVVDPSRPFILDIRLKDILGDASTRPLYTVKPSDTLASVVQLFEAKNISSAPVVHGDVHTGDFKVHGTMDVLEIAYLVLATSPNQLKSDIYVTGMSGDLANTTVQQIMEFSKKSACIALYDNSPFPLAVDLFNLGVHRALVFDHSTHDMFAVFSQTDAIRYLDDVVKKQREPVLNSWCRKTLREVGFKPHAVSAISIDETVGDAVEQMVKAETSSLALVEDTTLVGSFSSKLLRFLPFHTQDYYSTLEMSIREYLARYAPDSHFARSVWVTDTVETVLDILANDNLHHLYVVDVVSRRRSSISVNTHANQNRSNRGSVHGRRQGGQGGGGTDTTFAFSAPSSSSSSSSASSSLGSGSGGSTSSSASSSAASSPGPAPHHIPLPSSDVLSGNDKGTVPSKPQLQFRRDIIGEITLTDVVRMGCGAVQLPRPTQLDPAFIARRPSMVRKP